MEVDDCSRLLRHSKALDSFANSSQAQVDTMLGDWMLPAIARNQMESAEDARLKIMRPIPVRVDGFRGPAAGGSPAIPSSKMMTDSQILARAALFAQYKDAKEPTLRGQSIIDFVRSLSADELRALFGIASDEAIK